MTRAAAARDLARTAEEVMRLMRRSDATVRIFLVSAATMRRLGKDYLHKEQRLVDVLAFPEPSGFPHPDEASVVLGEVYLNWDAFKADLPHLSFLLIHGILHLLGYRHERKRDTMVMQKLERDLCNRTASQA